MRVAKHSVSKFFKAFPAREPPRRRNHRSIARFERQGSLNELVVDRCCRRSTAAAAIAELIRRISNDHVELHVTSKYLTYASLDVVGVDKPIGMSLTPLATV